MVGPVTVPAKSHAARLSGGYGDPPLLKQVDFYAAWNSFILNRRTAEQGTAEYRSLKHSGCFLNTSAVGYSLFDVLF